MPFVDEWETAGRIPRDLFKKAKAAGLLGIGYPTEYGGEGTEFDRFHGIVTSEELARIGAGGISSALMIHGIGLPPIMALGSALAFSMGRASLTVSHLTCWRIAGGLMPRPRH